MGQPDSRLADHIGQGTPSPVGAEEKKTGTRKRCSEESLRQMMPLGQGQIQEYRSRSDERDRALLPVSPNEKGTHGGSSGNTVLEENDSADLLRRDSDGRGGKSYRFTIRPT